MGTRAPWHATGAGSGTGAWFHRLVIDYRSIQALEPDLPRAGVVPIGPHAVERARGIAQRGGTLRVRTLAEGRGSHVVWALLDARDAACAPEASRLAHLGGVAGILLTGVCPTRSALQGYARELGARVLCAAGPDVDAIAALEDCWFAPLLLRGVLGFYPDDLEAILRASSCGLLDVVPLRPPAERGPEGYALSQRSRDALCGAQSALVVVHDAPELTLFDVNELLVALGGLVPPEASVLAQAIVHDPCPRPRLALCTLYGAVVAGSTAP